MKRRIAWLLATWFGCGLVPVAPGTVGTLGALPLYFLLRAHGLAAVFIAAVAITIAGVWSAGVVVRETEDDDPQRVVIDEVAGVLLTLSVAPMTWRGVIVGVVAFRVFDMTKPFPASQAERLPRGWGVMTDDLVAGLWAAAVVRVLA